MQLGARLSSEKLYERMKLNKPNTCCSVIYTVSNKHSRMSMYVSY